MNHSTVISKISNDSVTLLRSICEIAKTPNVHIISEQMQINPSLSTISTEQIIGKISYNYPLFVLICLIESILLVIFILEAFSIFDNNQQSYSTI